MGIIKNMVITLCVISIIAGFFLMIFSLFTVEDYSNLGYLLSIIGTLILALIFLFEKNPKENEKQLIPEK